MLRVRASPASLRCVLEQDKSNLAISTGSIQEDPPRPKCKIVDWDVKNQIKQSVKQMLNARKLNLFVCKQQKRRHLGRGMGFPTMWYVRPAKPQTSLRIRAV